MYRSSDLQSNRFSLISIDGDREDFLRVVKKAASEDLFCGAFFVSNPDFELENFTMEELAEAVCYIVKKLNSEDISCEDIYSIAQQENDTNDFIKSVKKINGLEQLSKGAEWAEALLQIVDKNHEITKNGKKQKRQIVYAIEFAIKNRIDNFTITREEYRVNPETGMPIKRS